jgi:hypothetical protein
MYRGWPAQVYLNNIALANLQLWSSRRPLSIAPIEARVRDVAREVVVKTVPIRAALCENICALSGDILGSRANAGIKSAFQNRCLWCADRYEHTRNRAISTENRTHLACDATPPTRF